MPDQVRHDELGYLVARLISYYKHPISLQGKGLTGVKNLIKCALFCTFIPLLSAFGSPAASEADSSLVTGGGAAQANVSFRIVIPPSLYLQVQSAPSDTLQASMLSKDDIETGDQAKGMLRLDVQAYGNVPKKGTMHLSSNSRLALGNAPGNPSAASPVEYPLFILCSP